MTFGNLLLSIDGDTTVWNHVLRDVLENNGWFNINIYIKRNGTFIYDRWYVYACIILHIYIYSVI